MLQRNLSIVCICHFVLIHLYSICAVGALSFFIFCVLVFLENVLQQFLSGSNLAKLQLFHRNNNPGDMVIKTGIRTDN